MFSILTPSYNYGRFIADALASVTSQSGVYKIEHVVQDALSDDSTKDVVESHSRLTAHILFSREADDGQSDAMNRALMRSSGEIVGWLNADEFYLPRALESVARVFANNPEVGVVYGDCVFVDEAGQFLRLLPSHRLNQFVLKHYGCFISSCAVFVRREVLLEGDWDVRYREAMDWDLWLRLANRTTMAYLPRALAAFRVHGSQVTKTESGARYAAGLFPSEEQETIGRRHGVKRSYISTRLATILHRALKTLDRGYSREGRARSSASGALVSAWWDEDGSSIAHQLIRI